MYAALFGLHPQGFAVSSAFSATSAFRHHSFNAARVCFVPEPELAPHPLGCLCPVVEGLSTPAELEAAPSFLSRIGKNAFQFIMSCWQAKPTRPVLRRSRTNLYPMKTIYCSRWQETRRITTIARQKRKATEPGPPMLLQINEKLM